MTVVYIILLLFSLKKSSLSSTRNVGHFVLFILFTCSYCTVVSITFFCTVYIGHLVLFLLFLLVLGTQWILSLVPRLLVSVLVPYYILLSFVFLLYACTGFVIVLVFLVPHIKLVYLAFFIQLRVMIHFRCKIWVTCKKVWNLWCNGLSRCSAISVDGLQPLALTPYA